VIVIESISVPCLVIVPTISVESNDLLVVAKKVFPGPLR